MANAGLGSGKVIVTKTSNLYRIEAVGTYGGGYSKGGIKTDKVVDEAAHALSYVLYGRRPVDLIAPADIREALIARGYNFDSGRTISIYLEDSTIAKLRAKAEQENQSVSALVQKAVKIFLE